MHQKHTVSGRVWRVLMLFKIILPSNLKSFSFMYPSSSPRILRYAFPSGASLLTNSFISFSRLSIIPFMRSWRFRQKVVKCQIICTCTFYRFVSRQRPLPHTIKKKTLLNSTKDFYFILPDEEKAYIQWRGKCCNYCVKIGMLCCAENVFKLYLILLVILGVTEVVKKCLGNLLWHSAVNPVQGLARGVWEKSLLSKQSFQCWFKPLSIQAKLKWTGQCNNWDNFPTLEFCNKQTSWGTNKAFKVYPTSLWFLREDTEY